MKIKLKLKNISWFVQLLIIIKNYIENKTDTGATQVQEIGIRGSRNVSLYLEQDKILINC